MKSTNLYLIMIYLIPIIIILFIFLAIIWETLIEYWILRIYKISSGNKFLSIKYGTAYIENNNIIVEFINYKRILCTDKNNRSNYIATKMDNSQYFYDKRFETFLKICSIFNENTDFKTIADKLKESLNVIEKHQKKEKVHTPAKTPKNVTKEERKKHPSKGKVRTPAKKQKSVIQNERIIDL